MNSDPGSIAPQEVPAEVPLFPLPDCVLFPEIVQPLHIFEPRYRAMTADCLAGNQLMVLCLLKPGHQELYETRRAPIYRYGCLARITVHKDLPDGRFVLIVRGVARVKILDEANTERPYRFGRVKLMRDEYPSQPKVDRARCREQLLRAFFQRFPELSENETLAPLLKSEMPLGTLCDLLAYASRLDAEDLLGVLECTDVDARCELVLERLSGMGVQEGADIPPPFSRN